MADGSPLDQQYSFLSHPVGKTHYDLSGPERGEVIVMVNGATLPLGVWQPLLAPLHERGFRTLRFDLSGRGWSTPLAVRAGLKADAYQIDRLLERVAPAGHVYFVGLASGAISVSYYARQRRERVGKAALIAPDGLLTRFTAIERIGLAPVIGEIMSAALAKRTLLNRAPRYSAREDIRNFVRLLLTFALKGDSYRRSVLDYVRTLPLHRGEKLYAELARMGVPVHVVWGGDDQITLSAAAGRLQEIFGLASVSILEGVGHLPHVEEPARVADLLCDHFQAKAAVPQQSARRHPSEEGMRRYAACSRDDPQPKFAPVTCPGNFGPRIS